MANGCQKSLPSPPPHTPPHKPIFLPEFVYFLNRLCWDGKYFFAEGLPCWNLCAAHFVLTCLSSRLGRPRLPLPSASPPTMPSFRGLMLGVAVATPCVFLAVLSSYLNAAAGGLAS